MQNESTHYEKFLELFLQHRDRLFSHIFSLIPHEADAEDVFQRCSIVLWKKFDEFDPSGSFLAWSYGVAVNEVRNFLKTRRRSRLAFLPDVIELLSEERLSNQDDYSDRMLALQDCVDQLRPEERHLVRIAYWGEQTVKEFAEATDASLQVMYNRLSKIRRTLLACIQRKLSETLRHG
ncbi:MAG TPA: sigma-70 family RNA polymerase sigma factor [Planctomicrobium sp.]|nr:sigma-70 family RNA polymerase sigma factor [Planctomicrobium sp.]